MNSTGDGTTDFVPVLIGRGTHTGVWEIRSPEFDKPMAVKQVIGKNPKANEVLRHEIAILSRISPNVPGVVHYIAGDVTAGLSTLFMEPLRRGSLADSCAKRPGRRLPWLEACTVLQGVGATLVNLHRLGVTVVDIKPDNIMMSDDDLPVLVDFGSSVVSPRSRLLTQEAEFPLGSGHAKTVLGTAAFVSPEALEGHISPPTDIYALGVTAYRIVTGRLPFKGDTDLETIALMMTQPFVPIQELVPDVPARLAILISACLRHKPRQRPTSKQFMLALGPIIQAATGSVAGDLWSPARRRNYFLPALVRAIAQSLQVNALAVHACALC